MRLTKAEFNGFGRLADAQINLDHKVVAVVGPNEAGKTTLLRALAYIDNAESLTVAQRSRGLAGDIADDHVVVRVQYRLSEADSAAVDYLDLNERPTELWLSRTAGAGEIGRTVVPAPRKNLVTLISARIHGCGECVWSWERANALLVWEDTACQESLFLPVEGHPLDASFS